MHFFSFLCGISLLVAVLATNYCLKNLCNGGKSHIACGNNGEFAGSCPEDVFLIDMNPYKQKIISLINGKRNKLAIGKMDEFASASRMATMQWDDELADLAAMNVRRCELSLDCHHTERYKFSGQNVYRETTLKKANPEKQLISAIETWWGKHENCTMDDIDEFKIPTSKIGQFTCLAAELNTAVGCAIATYSTDKKVFLLTCNFASCNVIGKPVYVSGRATSRCTSGFNPNFYGLCSENEDYDINYGS